MAHVCARYDYCYSGNYNSSTFCAPEREGRADRRRLSSGNVVKFDAYVHCLSMDNG